MVNIKNNISQLFIFNNELIYFQVPRAAVGASCWTDYCLPDLYCGVYGFTCSKQYVCFLYIFLLFYKQFITETLHGYGGDCYESSGACRKDLKLKCSYPSYTCK